MSKQNQEFWKRMEEYRVSIERVRPLVQTADFLLPSPLLRFLHRLGFEILPPAYLSKSKLALLRIAEFLLPVYVFITALVLWEGESLGSTAYWGGLGIVSIAMILGLTLGIQKTTKEIKEISKALNFPEKWEDFEAFDQPAMLIEQSILENIKILRATEPKLFAGMALAMLSLVSMVVFLCKLDRIVHTNPQNLQPISIDVSWVLSLVVRDSSGAVLERIIYWPLLCLGLASIIAGSLYFSKIGWKDRFADDPVTLSRKKVKSFLGNLFIQSIVSVIINLLFYEGLCRSAFRTLSGRSVFSYAPWTNPFVITTGAADDPSREFITSALWIGILFMWNMGTWIEFRKQARPAT